MLISYFKGGKTTVPADPAEYAGAYPECNMWGDLPAYGYFVRHAANVKFIDCDTTVYPRMSGSGRKSGIFPA